MGVRYLLDTPVVLWLHGDLGEVSPEVQGTLADRSVELIVSAVSAMEVATKVRLGKLEVARMLVNTWPARIAEIGAVPLSLSTEAALLAGQLNWERSDPFDRLLAAQEVPAGLELGPLAVDASARRVWVEDLEVHLSPLEFVLLLTLTAAPGTVRTREELMREVWGWADARGTRTLDTCVRTLRAKVGASRVRTVHGIGYAVEPA